MIYHYVITVSVERRDRWWRRVHRQLHTASGHAHVPGPHTERALYDYILASVARDHGIDPTCCVVLCYRLAPELGTLAQADFDTPEAWSGRLD